MSLQKALSMAATTMGLNENAQNAALSEYLSNGGINLDPSVTAWCAAFVNASLRQAGMEGTGKLNAQSFMEWGEETKAPQKGDIAVFWRGDPNSGKGHVGFFQGYDEKGNILVLGGNQRDSVNVSGFSPDNLLGYRTAPGGQGGNALATYGSMPGPAQQFPQQPPRPKFNRLDPAAFQIGGV